MSRCGYRSVHSLFGYRGTFPSLVVFHHALKEDNELVGHLLDLESLVFLVEMLYHQEKLYIHALKQLLLSDL
jgi:hypothetical protein